MPPAPRPTRGGGGGGGGARGPQGLQPGDYTLRMTVNGQTLTQPVSVKPDPRGVPANASADEMNNRS